METVQNICDFFDDLTPLELAEDWDNVGLLIGDANWPADSIMTCLTVTPDSVAEAIARKARVIVAHHPFPFRSLKRITSETTAGRLLLQLLHHRIAVYSPHTAFDSAPRGINQRWADRMLLASTSPLVAADDSPLVGAGRYGTLAANTTLAEFCGEVKGQLGLDRVRAVGRRNRAVRRVAIACGSAGEFLAAARNHGCDVLVTGETGFHTCLEAEAADIGLVLTGHYGSERFAVEMLADELQAAFDRANVWACEAEHDPLWMV